MILGITGGIGTGKSTVLKVLKDKYYFHTFEADKMGHEIIKPGMEAYKQIVGFFGKEILKEDGFVDRKILGETVFNDPHKLNILNGIIHPCVIKEIKTRIERIQKDEDDANFVIEAALLLESGCYVLCDKLWYIYSNDETRRQRLKSDRGYSDEQITSVMKNQLDYDEYLKKTDIIIDNSGSIEDTMQQIQEKLEA